MKSFIQSFGSGLHVQFVVNVVDVLLYGFLADKEFRCDFFIEVSFGEKIKYFRFTLSEQFNCFSCFPGFFHGIDPPSGNLAAHGRATLMEVKNGLQDLCR